MEDTVSLFRCRKCHTRMFLRDCPRHHARCVGGTFDPAAFERGPVTQPAKPGASHPSYHPSPWRGRRPKAADTPGEEDAIPDPDLDLELP